MGTFKRWMAYIRFKKEINLNNLTEEDYDKIFYKEKWINENGLEQRLIVSYSQKYADYQKHVREEQIQRAKKYNRKSRSSN